MPAVSAAADSFVTQNASAVEDRAVADAIAGLSVLGYSASEVNPIIRRTDWAGMSADQIIREVLKNMI